MRSVLAAVVSALLLTLAAPVGAASHIDTQEFRKGCPFSEDEWEDGVYDCGGRIPSIQHPSFDAGEWLQDNDRVIGVSVGQQAKAYPIPILNWHEIVNDRVDGTPIAVTYCPLCGSSVVFERVVDDQELTFHVSGYLYRQDLVMVDEETHSLWPQIQGEAARGEMHGTVLELFPSQTVTWKDWREQHPDTLVLARPGCGDGSTENRAGCQGDFQRDYTRSAYGNYETNRQIGITGENREDVRNLHPKDFVLGLVLDGTPKAYPLFALAQAGVVNDEIGGQPVVVSWASGDGFGYERPSEDVVFERDEANGTLVDGQGNVYDITTGTSPTGETLAPVDGLNLFWFAWLDHHPKTQLYTTNGTVEIDRDPPRSTPGFGAGLTGLVLLGLVALGVAARRRSRQP